MIGLLSFFLLWGLEPPTPIHLCLSNMLVCDYDTASLRG
jgi:hypothetical protein